ncbi:MAG: TRZ/ATZ family hydrolase [Gammaproteobacteria bacterium]
MQHIDQIAHAKWIITGEKNQPVLENHALVIDKGVIQKIVPSHEAKQHYQAKQVDDYAYHALLPGLINAHTHLGMNYFRGLGCDLMLMDWLNGYLWPAEKKWLSHEFVHDASLFAMAEMIRSGTTCFNDMFYFPEAIADAAITAGMRGFVSMHVIDFPTAWTKDTDESLEKGLEFYEKYHQQPLITPTLAPHAPYTVSDESFLRVLDLSKSLSLKINVHLHETKAEIEQSMTQYQKRPIKRLHDLGFLSAQVLAIHAVQLDAEDLEILNETRSNIVHCPESNMKLASGVCPVVDLQNLGLNVALGTDSVASNNDLNMLNEMRTATFLAKVTRQDPVCLNVNETLAMASLNGAKALGIDQVVGTLKAGKAADFIAINLDEIETLPVFDPLVQIIYSSSRHQVTDVWVAGKQLLKNRELLTIDEQALKAKARLWKL